MTYDRINVATGAALVAAVLLGILASITTIMTSDHDAGVERTRAKLAACTDFEVSSDRLACLAIVNS